MASDTTRMFRAVVVAGVSLTACSGAPVGESTPAAAVNDGKSTTAAAPGEVAAQAVTPVDPVN